MTLSSYRMHRIYLAATMDYGLGSDDPEELAYYKKLMKVRINESEHFFVNCMGA